MKLRATILLFALAASPAIAQKRLVIIDQDGAGPADGNQMAMMVLLQTPQAQVLGEDGLEGQRPAHAEDDHRDPYDEAGQADEQAERGSTGAAVTRSWITPL